MKSQLVYFKVRYQKQFLECGKKFFLAVQNENNQNKAYSTHFDTNNEQDNTDFITRRCRMQTLKISH